MNLAEAHVSDLNIGDRPKEFSDGISVTLTETESRPPLKR